MSKLTNTLDECMCIHQMQIPEGAAASKICALSCKQTWGQKLPHIMSLLMALLCVGRTGSAMRKNEEGGKHRKCVKLESKSFPEAVIT